MRGSRRLGRIPLAFVVAVMIGGLLGSASFTGYYGQGLSYLSSNPNACVNCHIMREQFDGWQKASHHNVAVCVDCHLPHDLVGKWLAKAENGFWHSKGFTLQDFHEPIRIHDKDERILQENCIRCHVDVVHEVLGHATNDVTVSCVRCHRSVGHGPEH